MHVRAYDTCVANPFPNGITERRCRACVLCVLGVCVCVCVFMCVCAPTTAMCVWVHASKFPSVRTCACVCRCTSAVHLHVRAYDTCVANPSSNGITERRRRACVSCVLGVCVYVCMFMYVRAPTTAMFVCVCGECKAVGMCACVCKCVYMHVWVCVLCVLGVYCELCVSVRVCARACALCTSCV